MSSLADRLPSGKEFLSALRNRRALLSFDFDGTLVELAARPGDVRLRPAVHSALGRMAREFPVLLCTGRGVRDLLEYLPGIPELDVIGNHGLEWRLYDRALGKVVEKQLTPPEWKGWRAEVIPRLEKRLEERGGFLEDKGHSLSLHYRLEGTEYWSSPAAETELKRWAAPVADVLGGKACWNLLPRGASKGQAVVQFMREQKFEELIYFGDEHTDETVFARKEFPIHGVKVGQEETAARYRLSSVSEVHAWVLELAGELGR